MHLKKALALTLLLGNSQRSDTHLSMMSEYEVGDSVHTSAGAGVVAEVKTDNVFVRISNGNYVHVEYDGDIEHLPAVPGDSVSKQPNQFKTLQVLSGYV